MLVNLAHDMAVEIAIGAFRGAERPMDIEAEPDLLPIFTQSSLQQIVRQLWPGG